MLTHAPWTAIAGLRHGFLDRAEYMRSEGWQRPLGSRDAPLPLVTARQVHGTRVVAADPGVPPPEADALAIAGSGFLVGVVTADCAPVLLVSPARRAAVAVHAGWRGAAAGVLEAAVEYLHTELGAAPDTLEAVIGPTIGPCCYEVGDEVRKAFEGRTGRLTAPAWSVRARRLYVDLRAAARLLLAGVAVTTTSLLGPCTACGAGYSSYRRDGAGAGRQLSFVGWA
jgi:YfiH family protein